MKRQVAILLFAAWLAPNALAAAHCRTPSSQKVAQVQGYVASLDNVGSAADLKLVESIQASSACYWKLHFETSASKRQITVYLSPDQQYLTPDIYDLGIDPLTEQRSHERQLIKTLALGDPPARGPSTADITIVEFSDFECPFCRRLTDVLEKQLNTGDSPNVRLVFRNFPLPMHAWANDAARMGECAASQNGASFWKLHDFYFSNQQILNQNNVYDKTIAFAATGTDLDIAQFKSCIDKHSSAKAVADDIDMGRQNNVKATPTMFVNGVRYEGSRDATQLSAIIEAAKRGDVWPVTAARPQTAAVPTVAPNQEDQNK